MNRNETMTKRGGWASLRGVPLLPILALAIGSAVGVGVSVGQPAAISLSPDVTVDLSGTTLEDRNVGHDDLVGMVQVFQVGTPGLPSPWADVVGYHALPGGDQLLVLDITQSLPGLPAVTGTATGGDVILYDGAAYSIALDASDFVAGARVDAVSMRGGDLLLSFDTAVRLSGISFGDEDLLRFDQSSFFLEFDGSAEGIDAGLDLDAAHLDESTGGYFLSFDGSGTVDGISFDDEDILSFDPGGGTWQLAYDGSAEHAGWRGGDLDALFISPSPIEGLIFADGFESGSTSAWSGSSSP